ncbi:TPA: maltoporin LamB [Vibrio vulnificus]|nr:maltoporin LamB [Vibrio vulnificus]HDY8018504.1 maltoporin LamB [Vibrio vulnificus]
MKLKKTILVVSVFSAFNALADSDTSYFGYIRSGIGMSGNNGQDVQFHKNQLGRLGNENDTYGEWGIKNEVYNQNGVSFDVESMAAIYTDGSTGWETSKDEDFTVALPQIDVQAKGIIKSAPEATLWAGKRYYQRHNVDLADFYYWNISGAGAGVEGIQTEAGKLSVAWIRTDRDKVIDKGNNSGVLNVNVLDARLAEIPLWRNASLEVGGDYAIANESSSYEGDVKNGFLFNVELTQNFSFGNNKTVFQYGTEGYGKTISDYGDGSWYGAEAESGAAAYRVINWGVIQIADRWEMGHQLVWSSSTDDIDAGQTKDISYFSSVVRPVYKWDENMKTLFEVGYFNRNVGDGSEESGSKITVAQAWTAGLSYWARPEIRLYASYFTDFDNTDALGAGKDSEFNLGVQAEVWW